MDGGNVYMEKVGKFLQLFTAPYKNGEITVTFAKSHYSNKWKPTSERTSISP